MRTPVLSTAILATFIGTASVRAADPPPPPAPPLAAVEAPAQWGGLYLGAFAGYGWSATPSTIGLASATMALFPPIIPTIENAGSNKVKWAGALVGLSGGYNVMLGENVLAGVEADFTVPFMSGRVETGGVVPVFNGPFRFEQKTSMDWMSTLRARMGLVLTDRAMAYVTGGVALAQLRHSSDFADVFSEYEFFRLSATRFGWTLGAGLEYAFSRNWSAKVEYLHAAFGGASGLGYSILNDGSLAWVHHRLRDTSVDMVRIGVNYRFGGEAPVVAKY
ncbi:MAG TPA: outer membrane beta-barrel protein [Rhodoblastus sp.]|nr:outer membrane beta-barrel protein [Rhodoblastus sp.]